MTSAPLPPPITEPYYKPGAVPAVLCERLLTAVGGGYYYPNFSNKEAETQRTDSLLDEQGRASLTEEMVLERAALEAGRRVREGNVLSAPGLL